MKRWGAAVLATVISVIALAGAGGFWWVWSAETFASGEPGQWYTTSDGVAFRLDGLSQATEQLGPTGEVLATAADGAAFVVADISVIAPADASASLCSLRLVGQGRNIWRDAGGMGVHSYDLCNPAVEDPGVEHSGQMYFEVPEDYLDQIRGIAIEQRLAGLEPVMVLTMEG